MSPYCFLHERIKNTQKKTVIMQTDRFSEEIDNGSEAGFDLISDSVKMAKFMSYFNDIFDRVSFV